MVKIITHGGDAHRDEFVACCLLLAKFDPLVTEILRVPHAKFNFAMQVGLDFVVDLGMEFNPAIGRLDHHQLKPAFGESRSAFAMVAEDILGWDAVTAKSVFPWYQLSSDMDCHGPTQVAASLGTTCDGVESLRSPIEAQFLRIFEKDPNACIPFMREMGQGWIDYYNNYAAAEESHKGWGHCEILGLTVLELTGIPRGELHTAVTAKIAKKTGANIIVSLDPTGEGVQLYRVDDHPAVNFSNLAGQDGILFAHSNGFIAKTTNMDVDWLKLLEVSLLMSKMAITEVPADTADILKMSNMELAS